MLIYMVHWLHYVSSVYEANVEQFYRRECYRIQNYEPLKLHIRAHCITDKKVFVLGSLKHNTTDAFKAL